MNGRTPMEVMDELLPPSERRIPDMAAISPLFWDVQQRTVTNCKVQLSNATYSAAPDDPEGQQAMYLANGGTVAVHCDPNDLARALAYEDKPSGRLLARLVCDELAAREPVTQERVKAIARERARLRRASREALEIVSAGVPSEIELLAQRGGIEPRPPMRPPVKLSEPRIKTFACDVSDEAAALLDQVEVVANDLAPGEEE